MNLKLVTDGGDLVRVHAVRGREARRGFRGLPPPGPQEGLLFPFGRRRRIPDFTMLGVPFDLDLVLLDRDHGYPTYTVIGVQHLPAGERTIRVNATGVAALELAVGEAERLGLRDGSLLSISW